MNPDELQAFLRLIHKLACEENMDAIIEEVEPYIDTDWEEEK